MSTERQKLTQHNAFIEIDGVHYFSRLFFMSSRAKDVLFVLWRDSKDAGLWHFDFRFRYILDENTGYESKDEKSYTECTMEEGTAEAVALEKAKFMVGLMGDMWNAMNPDKLELGPEEVVIESDDVSAFQAALQDKPWAHFQAVAMPS